MNLIQQNLKEDFIVIKQYNSFIKLFTNNIYKSF